MAAAAPWHIHWFYFRTVGGHGDVSSMKVLILTFWYIHQCYTKTHTHRNTPTDTHTHTHYPSATPAESSEVDVCEAAREEDVAIFFFVSHTRQEITNSRCQIMQLQDDRTNADWNSFGISDLTSPSLDGIGTEVDIRINVCKYITF